MFRIKICGIVTREDAHAAVENGADAVGFLAGIRHRAEDRIDPEEAARIAASLPGGTKKVLVTHLETAGEIVPLIETAGCRIVQVQGAVSHEGMRALRRNLEGCELIKALHVGPSVDERALEEILQEARDFLPYVDGLLLDSRNPAEDRIGGTGMVHDWEASREIVRSVPCPVILAGGLNPGNVREAVQAVRPFGVDVNSGVEEGGRSPTGRKDPVRLGEFIAAARQSFGY